MNETLSSSSASGAQPDHDSIARQAQYLWQKYGRPEGRDEEIWLEAERTLKAPTPAPGTSNVPPVSIFVPPASTKAGAPKNGPSSRATAAAKIPPLKASKNAGR